MPDDDRRRDRRAALPRRRYLQLLVGTGAVGLAGCSGGGSGGTSTGDGDGNRASDTVVDTDTASGTGAATSAGRDTNAATSAGSETGSPPDSEGTDRGEPVSDTVTVGVNNIPEQSNFNPWAATVRSIGVAYLTEMTAPKHWRTNEALLSGHTWDAPWTDEFEEISVPTMYTDFRVEAPFDTYESFNQNLTYWDGTPLDTTARLQDGYLWYASDGLKFNETATFNEEAVDQWNYHRWRDKGEVEGQAADPAAARVLEEDAVPGNATPMHPDFTTPYYERYREASSQDQAAEITRELEGDTVPFSRFAAEGWGSGPYTADPDDISQNRLLATLRDDHPNEHITVPNLELRFATPDRKGLLLQEGEIDVLSDLVQENGRFTRERLPDYIQEYALYSRNAGDQVLMNWNNKHLRNLWVRRAIVAAVDWIQVGDNGWGPKWSEPVTNHVGLVDTVAEDTFSEEFLDSLYTYPMEADPELANEWMQRAGYTKQGGTWVSPDGTPFELVFTTNTALPSWIGSAQTIAANLDAVGLPTDFQSLTAAAFNSSLEAANPSFETTFQWVDVNPGWQMYASELGGAWWRASLLDGDQSTAPATVINPDDYGETDAYGKPFETAIPSEAGSIEAPDEAGANPDLENGVQVSLPEVAKSLIRPGLDEEQFQQNMRKLARYYNYYVPGFIFHQYKWGLIGNVRDFNYPPEGHSANSSEIPGRGGPGYAVLAGLVQSKYDEGFPTPSG